MMEKVGQFSWDAGSVVGRGYGSLRVPRCPLERWCAVPAMWNKKSMES